MTVYGQRLAEAMGRSGISPKELAKKAGVSVSTIYKAMEKDASPNALTLACLADVLHVTMDWLWGR